jgi:hypothetical protein
MSRPLLGNVQVEASAFRCPVVYTNALTNEESRYTLDQLPMNMGAVTPGRFYCQMHPLRYFYCDARQGDLLRWLLIESFQSGQLIRSTFTQNDQYGPFYIPVRDKKVLARLQGRLSDYLALSGIKISPRPGFRAPTSKRPTRPKKTRRPRRR